MKLQLDSGGYLRPKLHPFRDDGDAIVAIGRLWGCRRAVHIYDEIGRPGTQAAAKHAALLVGADCKSPHASQEGSQRGEDIPRAIRLMRRRW